MKLVRRMSVTIAVVSVCAIFVIGLVPIRVVPIEHAAPPGGGSVSCGTVFSGTEWALDDACERATLRRGGWVVLALLVSAAFGLLAVGSWLAQRVQSRKLFTPLRPS